MMAGRPPVPSFQIKCVRVITFIRRNGATCPPRSNIFAMDHTHTIVSQRAARSFSCYSRFLLSFAVAALPFSTIRRWVSKRKEPSWH